ncbi:hypothetical protein [Endozoicomonas sp. GU-1]|uniref:hypothetical protein n=1 Tax=Endozoicomonas sp. GU-1 TaxID=3009078 RepID=UPI0022B2C658|nr:hypothetical protein [Endozoicomonas sp. GU-1]WBA83471.1 hypothetical protein O2T12_10250 [Endozoicomonas sp. GU-1]WBA86403.1 hypothetical protein O3276_24930 [Endozoicomonas sp. GU-1]
MTANNGNGTSQAELRDGSVINVKGESERHSTECFGRYVYAEKATVNLHPITSFSTCRISGKGQRFPQRSHLTY